ncbi:MAG: Aspartate-tRNA ligase [Candidatus Peregrinibacteria bacterium GW2011_GWA2_47_7]|nr:MAG: Aspartate-tRNA ligase [Candidatus Peregrinibacteria bacterium GW2011_GWA2_47_7]
MRPGGTRPLSLKVSISAIIGAMKIYRTDTCGDLSADFEGKKVTIAGWVHSRRDHGGLIFVDLRDRYGVTQIVSDPEHHKEAHNTLDKVRGEFVLSVQGTVRRRPSGMENKKIATGAVEVLVDSVTILNQAKTPPFEIDQDKEVNEELRLKYRYLDLRRARMKNNLVMRHKMIKLIRDYLDARNFLEIETPILIKGTPEGSREFLVPSRLHEGNFYVLPQSPQQLKQLLMVAGMDRYFQIARCFRDEDQRGDRQPEFTQLDMELSFVDEKDVMEINEGLMVTLVEKLQPHKKIQEKPFPVITWQEAMDTYGSDKPDLRFGLTFVDVTSAVQNSGFKVFKDAAALEEGVVKALKIPGGAKFSRREIDELTAVAKIYGAKGLAYITMENAELKSPILKFLDAAEQKALQDLLSMENGDIVFFAADTFRIACESLGAVRLECGKKLDLMDKNELAFCWVIHFPMFEVSKETGEVGAAHHPFCSIQEEDIPLLETNPLKARAKAYDLVMNGVEVGGGSIRIHTPELQSKIFDILKISREDAQKRFGHMLEAFQYGAPPHGGIAWGLDRLVMIFQDEPNIREVIAFPKDQRARDLMLNAPSTLPDKQVAEMHIRLIEKKE